MIQTLPLTSIRVPAGRQRTSIDDTHLAALVTSISTVGLLQPLVVRTSGPDTILVAGERRLRAIENIAILGGRIRCAGEDVPEGHAPICDIGSLDPLAAFEAELEENIRRVDLTWQERTAAEARLVQLRREQARASGASEPSMLDIGAELAPDLEPDVQRERARQAVLLQDAMKSNPAIAKAATQNDAWKLFKRDEQAKRDTALGAIMGKEKKDSRSIKGTVETGSEPASGDTTAFSSTRHTEWGPTVSATGQVGAPGSNMDTLIPQTMLCDSCGLLFLSCFGYPGKRPICTCGATLRLSLNFGRSALRRAIGSTEPPSSTSNEKAAGSLGPSMALDVAMNWSSTLSKANDLLQQFTEMYSNQLLNATPMDTERQNLLKLTLICSNGRAALETMSLTASRVQELYSRLLRNFNSAPPPSS
jgi:ParB-like chromosome segregation protein Spo0J